MGIPYSIMEEHRDAFYHWFAMAETGCIPASGNYLLHVDHHDDMLGGGYAFDLRRRPASAAEAFAIADRYLGIADFILPAVAYGLFSTVHIVKNLMPCRMEEAQRIVLVRREGSELAERGYLPFLHAQACRETDSGTLRWTRRENGLNGPADLAGAENLVLDVDLDYFCWDDSLSSVPEKRMEVTAEAWRAYQTDRNHPFRIVPKMYFHGEERDGRYFLVYRECAKPDPLPAEERVQKRIDRFLDWLSKTGVQPKAVDICRSARSGYLPSQRAAFVEERFLKGLRELYDLCPAPYPAAL